MVQRNVLVGPQRALRRSSRETQGKAASGKEITRPSDDPFDAAQAMGLRQTLDGERASTSATSRTRRAGRTRPSPRWTSITDYVEPRPATCSSQGAHRHGRRRRRATRSPPRSTRSSRASRRPRTPRYGDKLPDVAAPRPTTAPYDARRRRRLPGRRGRPRPGDPGRGARDRPRRDDVDQHGRPRDPRRRPGRRPTASCSTCCATSPTTCAPTTAPRCAAPTSTRLDEQPRHAARGARAQRRADEPPRGRARPRLDQIQEAVTSSSRTPRTPTSPRRSSTSTRRAPPTRPRCGPARTSCSRRSWTSSASR